MTAVTRLSDHADPLDDASASAIATGRLLIQRAQLEGVAEPRTPDAPLSEVKRLRAWRPMVLKQAYLAVVVAIVAAAIAAVVASLSH